MSGKLCSAVVVCALGLGGSVSAADICPALKTIAREAPMEFAKLKTAETWGGSPVGRIVPPGARRCFVYDKTAYTPAAYSCSWDRGGPSAAEALMKQVEACFTGGAVTARRSTEYLVYEFKALFEQGHLAFDARTLPDETSSGNGVYLRVQPY